MISPSQRTAPLPSVNTSTEYSLARARASAFSSSACALGALTLVLSVERPVDRPGSACFRSMFRSTYYEACAFVSDLGQSSLSVIQANGKRFYLLSRAPPAARSRRPRSAALARTPPAPRASPKHRSSILGSGFRSSAFRTLRPALPRTSTVRTPHT
jgi:hypothetical protein